MSTIKLLATAIGGVASVAVAAYLIRSNRRSALAGAEELGPGQGEAGGERPRKGGRAKSFLTERGITGKKLTQALVVHECLGMCLLAGSWGLCYFVRPSSRLAAFLEHAGLHGATSKALGELGDAAGRKVARLFGGSGDTARLTKSLAESMLLRTVLTPLTMPLKLYLTYSIVA